MGLDINNMTSTAANSALGGIVDNTLGIATQGIKNNQNLKYLKKQGEIQKQNEKEMMEYAQDLKERAYKGNVQGMLDAGLNVGLMYQGAGAGGNVATPGTSSGQQAQQQSNAGAMGIGIQGALTKAQLDNIQADTEKKKVEAVKLAGADTANVQADTAKKEKEAIKLAADTGLSIEQAKKVIEEQYKTKAETTNIQAGTKNINADTELKGAQKQNTETDTIKKEAETKNIKQATQAIIAQIHNGQIQLDQKDIELYQGEWRIRNEATKIKIETELRKMGLDVENKKVMNDALKTIILGGSILNGMPGSRPIIGY